jgi:hypothetical protein
MQIHATLNQLRRMLINLDGILGKAEKYAESKKFDVNVLTTWRVAPDMFPFTRQIQSTCDAAKFCAAYLSETAPPVHEDKETTWSELRQRVQKVIQYLEGFKESDFKNAANVKVSPRWAKGQSIGGEDYFYQVAIPNFYFHLTTAYALLRGAGVDIGKMDYLGNINLK